MDPDTGDPGALGAVFDTLSGSVESVERFGNVLARQNFTMTEAMVWAVIAVVIIRFVIMPWAMPWNAYAVDRARSRLGGDRPLTHREKDRLIADLQSRLAAIEAREAAPNVTHLPTAATGA